MFEATVTLKFQQDVSDVLRAVRTCEELSTAFDVLQSRFDGGYISLADGTITSVHPADVIALSIRGIHRNPEDPEAIDVVGMFDF